MDHLLIVCGVVLAQGLRFGFTWSIVSWSQLWRASLIGLVIQTSLHYCDLYDVRLLRDRREQTVALLQALGAASLVLALFTTGYRCWWLAAAFS